MRTINSSVCRARLAAWLLIPLNASDQGVHALIEAGFTSESVSGLFELGVISATVRDPIIPYKTLKNRLAHGRRLSAIESDRLFRVVRIIAMTEALFGNQQKATRWLSTSKSCFSGKSPFAMLCTFQGCHLVEERLFQTVEGFTF